MCSYYFHANKKTTTPSTELTNNNSIHNLNDPHCPGFFLWRITESVKRDRKINNAKMSTERTISIAKAYAYMHERILTVILYNNIKHRRTSVFHSTRWCSLAVMAGAICLGLNLINHFAPVMKQKNKSYSNGVTSSLYTKTNNAINNYTLYPIFFLAPVKFHFSFSPQVPQGSNVSILKWIRNYGIEIFYRPDTFPIVKQSNC